MTTSNSNFPKLALKKSYNKSNKNIKIGFYIMFLNQIQLVSI